MFTTYQPQKCFVTDSARILIPKKETIINKYIGMFLATIFIKNMPKFFYGNSANPEDIAKLNVFLPSKNNQPD
jgi:hypothetical protein